MAAVRALGMIGTPECLSALTGLIEDFVGCSPYLADALKGCGCEIRRKGAEWHYRLPNQEHWQVIR